jgi:hypothetical protein
MLESPEICRLSFQLGIQSDGINILDFAEGIKIKLPHKTGKLGVFEELRDDLPFKLARILHHKGLSILRPASNGRVTAVYHVVGFCKMQTWSGEERAANREKRVPKKTVARRAKLVTVSATVRSPVGVNQFSRMTTP